jgi:membrane protease YdiL (CAAX protease family)
MFSVYILLGGACVRRRKVKCSVELSGSGNRQGSMTTNKQTPVTFNSFLANRPKLAIALTAVGFAGFLVLELVPAGKILPVLLLFFSLGVVALYLMPFVLGLPNGRKAFREYCHDIRLLPIQPLGRNIALGLVLAFLTLASIFLASLLTGHFVFDWTLLPALRWVKGLTRGIWEEVFFRGIILVLFMRLHPDRKAVLLSAFLFAMMHLSVLSLEVAIDLISLFFMGLLFAYVVLKAGSLWPAIIFHYVHDIFILLVQNTPGADKVLSLVLFYSFLWGALVIGALLTKLVVEHWPGGSHLAMK